MKIGMGEGDKSGPKMLSKTEINFITTVFIICLCYFLCAIPGVLLCDILGMGGDPIVFLVALTFVWLQFTMNIFIYSYRVKKYKRGYLDFIALVFPCLSNLVQKMKGETSTQNTTTNATANIPSIASSSKAWLNWTIHERNTNTIVEKIFWATSITPNISKYNWLK